MRQLTSLDAQFLALESPRQTGHVGALAILDDSERAGGKLEIGDVCKLIEERLALLPPLHWRLAEVPLGLDYPYWIEDPEFDLDFHVRELALPAPGADAKLAEQVARIIARPLDRSRPLWELYLIHGLEGGGVGMLTKVHHAVIDGLSGAEIMAVLFDLAPEGRKLGDGGRPNAEREPSDVEMLARGLAGIPRYPARMLRSVPRTLPNLTETPFGTLPGAGVVSRVAGRVQRALIGDAARAGRPTPRAPKTSFNRRISAHRRFAFGQLSLEEVKAIKNEHGFTVNDVVVTIATGAVRRWLIEHGELPAEPLVAQIPVSVRTSEQAGTYGNRIMLMSAPIYTNLPDPIVRLRKAHESLAVMKERHRALPAELLQDANHFIPPAVFARAARATFALATSSPGRPTWNLVISNVPGPQVPLYCAGARLDANYPVSVITDGMGLNITVMSYCGHLDFGIVADRDQMPDLWKMIDWLSESLEELRPRERRRRTATDSGAAGGGDGVPASGKASRASRSTAKP
jgi:diacylglycerol O-acyltransferase / wax synthase